MSFTFKDCGVELSANGTTWTNISAHAAAVEVSGGDRQSGEVYTFTSDVATLGVGKREPYEVTVRALYTETTSEAFEMARGAYEAGTAFFVRWSPRGGTTGQAQYTTSSGIITSLRYPQGESSGGELIMTEITVRCASVTRALIA